MIDKCGKWPWTSVTTTQASEPQFGQNHYLFFSCRSWQSFSLIYYIVIVGKGSSSIIIFFIIIHDFREEYLQNKTTWNMAHEVTPKGLRTGASFFMIYVSFSDFSAKKIEKQKNCYLDRFFLIVVFGEMVHHIIQFYTCLLCQGQAHVPPTFSVVWNTPSIQIWCTVWRRSS